jgi:hypothetical protein
MDGLKFVSDVELEDPILREQRAFARIARKALNKRRYRRHYLRGYLKLHNLTRYPVSVFL